MGAAFRVPHSVGRAAERGGGVGCGQFGQSSTPLTGDVVVVGVGVAGVVVRPDLVGPIRAAITPTHLIDVELEFARNPRQRL